MDSKVYVGVFGDIHGRIALMYTLAALWEAHTHKRLAALLQVGDMGAFPSMDRLDRATAAHAKRDTDELGFQQFCVPTEEGARYLERSDAPETFFIRGNHEDFVYLQQFRSLSAVDPWQKIHFLPDGTSVSLPLSSTLHKELDPVLLKRLALEEGAVEGDGTLAPSALDGDEASERGGAEGVDALGEAALDEVQGGDAGRSRGERRSNAVTGQGYLRVGGFGGIPFAGELEERGRGRKARQKMRRAQKKKEKEAKYFSDDVCRWAFGPGEIDVLLSHAGPDHPLLPDGSAALASLAKRARPKFHFFGHHHRVIGPVEVEGCQLVGLEHLDFDREGALCEGAWGILCVEPATKALDFVFACPKELPWLRDVRRYTYRSMWPT